MIRVPPAIALDRPGDERSRWRRIGVGPDPGVREPLPGFEERDHALDDAAVAKVEAVGVTDRAEWRSRR